MKSLRSFHRKARGLSITRLMKRDGQSCMICGTPLDRSLRDPESPFYITFDHKLPRSRGGGSGLENMRLAHRRCNMERGNDPLVEE